ncbi:nitroreductase family deazaflavin-dependent oxidoreductase [Actinomadura sp. ATCC 31491]|uniref:Nitroreductase family deazaflavin-dependent oxidoreductase n=1 Tax=Actinomadura luzonensis TaxID=2805427 RepID=A0ABT0FTJ0_9ACTN|nr:nitroreductase family deazaflavin-dependent oxidoreductase [Actinomadura luzonensis]MCK2215648.1 nitroreductase family deazaflavin-dependent oxidoreductase [Actinomadura luzonensis]
MTRRPLARTLAALKRATYRGGRPGALMRLVNRLDALLYGAGRLSPRNGAVLRVTGRGSGEVTPVPVAVASWRGAEYLVSMLGPEANWVRNVRAAGGAAVLRRRGRDTPVLLEEVPPEGRAEILRRYLAAAPGARPHLGLGPAAPPAEFRRIAPRHPVFRIHLRVPEHPAGA